MKHIALTITLLLAIAVSAARADDVQVVLNLHTPQGMSIAEALRLFTDHHNYQTEVESIDENGEVTMIPNPQNRSDYFKAVVGRKIRQSILAERRKIAREAAEEAVPDDVTVD